jgi:hypothetical protein
VSKETAPVTDERIVGWIKICDQTWRMEVPGGWLYQHWEEDKVAMCFVPQPAVNLSSVKVSRVDVEAVERMSEFYVDRAEFGFISHGAQDPVPEWGELMKRRAGETAAMLRELLVEVKS